MDGPQVPNNELDDGAPVNPRVSIVICTFNRTKGLERAINSVLDQAVPECQFEIIVVDNNSTDETAAVVKGFTTNHPNVRYVFEPEQGLSFARNTGWREAKGEYVAYIDDDARAEEGWLSTILQTIDAASHPLEALGGPIYPFYTCPKPDWFRDEWEVRSWGEVPRYLEPNEFLSGSNMVLRRSALVQLGGFAEQLGMRGGSLILGEETHLFKRAQEEFGPHCVYYNPDIRVRHEVPRWRVSVRYRLRRSFASGRAVVMCAFPMSKHRRLFVLGKSLAQAGRSLLRALARAPRYRSCRAWAAAELVAVAKPLGRATACARGRPLALRSKKPEGGPLGC